MLNLSKNNRISKIIISTICGHSGLGIFPYILFPTFWIFMLTAWKTKTLIIAKSATRYKWTGNFVLHKPKTWRFVHKIKDKKSILNAFGMTNPGAVIYAIMLKITLLLGFNVIPSLFAVFPRGYKKGLEENIEAIHIFKKILGKHFWALELVPSCPNSGEDIFDNQYWILELCKRAKKEFPYTVIIVKGSVIYPGNFYTHLEEAGIDIIHTINTIPFDKAVGLGISPYQFSPFGEKTKGGYSGEIIKLTALNYAKNTTIPSTKNRLIFGGGVSDESDMVKYMKV